MYRIELSDKDYELIQFLVWTYTLDKYCTKVTYEQLEVNRLCLGGERVGLSDVKNAWHSFILKKKHIPDKEVSDNEQTDTEV